MRTAEYKHAPFLYTGLSAGQNNSVLLALLVAHVFVVAAMRDTVALFSIVSTELGALSAALVQTLRTPHVPLSDSLVLGLLIGAVLPAHNSFLNTFCVAFCAVFFTRVLFGGKIGNWLNPIALAPVLLRQCTEGTSLPTSGRVSVVQGAMSYPLFYSALVEWDAAVRTWCNTQVFQPLGLTLPEGALSACVFTQAAAPGFRYPVLTLLAALCVYAVRARRYICSCAFLVVYSTLFFLPAHAHPATLVSLIKSGALFTAFFVLPEPDTSMRTNGGAWISGGLCAMCAFFLAKKNSSAPDMWGAHDMHLWSAILLTNIVQPLILRAESWYYYVRRRRYDVQH